MSNIEVGLKGLGDVGWDEAHGKKATWDVTMFLTRPLLSRVHTVCSETESSGWRMESSSSHELN